MCEQRNTIEKRVLPEWKHHMCSWVTCVDICSQHPSKPLAGLCPVPRGLSNPLTVTAEGLPCSSTRSIGRRAIPSPLCSLCSLDSQFHVGDTGGWSSVGTGCDWPSHSFNHGQQNVAPPSPPLAPIQPPDTHGDQGSAPFHSIGTPALPSLLGWWVPHSF